MFNHHESWDQDITNVQTLWILYVANIDNININLLIQIAENLKFLLKPFELTRVTIKCYKSHLSSEGGEGSACTQEEEWDVTL